jgi:cyclopropane fatty-acyl-phospholipid synthase-like methyltransferase
VSTLNDLGLKYNCDKSSRFHDYLDFYEQHLPGRDFAGRLLEIGVMDGVSMQMWREYYPKAEIVGIDIYDKQHLYNSDWQLDRSIKLLKVDGTDPVALDRLGMFDIIVDDGSHFTRDQQASFDILYYRQLNPGGVYIIEDIWTSRMDVYQNSEFNTIEWLKNKRLFNEPLDMSWFSHEHAEGEGMALTFPQWPEYGNLASETVIIRTKP